MNISLVITVAILDQYDSSIVLSVPPTPPHLCIFAMVYKCPTCRNVRTIEAIRVYNVGFKCSICLEHFENKNNDIRQVPIEENINMQYQEIPVAVMLQCGHLYCRECLKDYDNFYQTVGSRKLPNVESLTRILQRRRHQSSQTSNSRYSDAFNYNGENNLENNKIRRVLHRTLSCIMNIVELLISLMSELYTNSCLMIRPVPRRDVTPDEERSIEEQQILITPRNPIVDMERLYELLHS